jgi:hypothetical protein
VTVKKKKEVVAGAGEYKKQTRRINRRYKRRGMKRKRNQAGCISATTRWPP